MLSERGKRLVRRGRGTVNRSTELNGVSSRSEQIPWFHCIYSHLTKQPRPPPGELTEARWNTSSRLGSR